MVLDRLRVWASRIRGLLTRRRLDDDFRQELDAHLALLTEENIRRGMTPEEARRAARVRLGGVTQLREAHREAWGWPMLETLVQDVCYGLRQLRRSPGFTLVAVLTLALGIGANTAIFSVVYGIILRPLPYRDAGRLAVVWTHRAEKPDSRYPVSLPDFKDWETQNSVFDRLAAFASNRYVVHGLEGGVGLRGAVVTPGFFRLLGV